MADKKNDGYFQPLVDRVNDQTNDDINALNIVGVYRQCISVNNKASLISPRSGYPRRCFIRVHDEGECTQEVRLQGLQVIRSFLLTEESNEHETAVFIEPNRWDLTNYSAETLPNVDHHIVYNDIKRLIDKVLGEGEANHMFATTHEESKNIFFTPGKIPFKAANELGFDPDECLPDPTTAAAAAAAAAANNSNNRGT